MKSKDTVALTALRSIKSAILLARTSGSDAKLTEEDEFKLLQKLVKKRRDSAAIFTEQNRSDLAEPELAEVELILNSIACFDVQSGAFRDHETIPSGSQIINIKHF